MNLKKKTFIGFLWQAAGTVGSGLIGLLVTMLLARHLSPQDFGVIEIILSFVVISEVLIDSGFSQAIIREREITSSDLTAIFGINLSIAGILYLLLFLAAPSIAGYFNATGSFVMSFRVLALKILFDALSISQIAECTRQMRFDIISQNTIIAMLVAGIFSVAAVLCGAGIMALVIYYLSLSICKAILINVRVRLRPAFDFYFPRIKRFAQFGANIMLTQILDKGITSIESLCIGKVYSKADLGIFSQARKLDALVVQSLFGVVQKVTYPALAKIDSETNLKTGYKSLMQLCLWVIFPIAIFMFSNPDVVICSFFGDQWLPAAPFLRLFSIYSMLYPLQCVGMNIFLVKNKSGMIRNLSIVKQVVRILTIICMLHFSMIAFTCGVVANALLGAVLFIVYGGRLIDYNLAAMIKDNLKTVITAIALGIISYYCCRFSPLSYIADLLIFGGGFGILYVVASLVFKNQAYTLCRSLVNSLRS